MDWLLKVLGVSAKNRKLVKTTSNAIKAVAQPKPAAQTSNERKGRKDNRSVTVDIDDLPYDEYEIVGEAHYQSILAKHAGPKTTEGADFPCEVLLVCERGNKHDKNAVRVEINGDTVGYLSRDDAASFREMLDEEDLRGAKVTARARITGGWKREGSEGHYGIVLDFE